MGSCLQQRELNLVLCDSLDEGDGAEGWGEVQEVRAQVYVWLIQIVVWKRPI